MIPERARTEWDVKVSIFGLGYTGLISGACFAEMGHRVVGVDLDRMKVDLVNAGRSHIVENGLDDLLAKGVKRRLLRATLDGVEAVRESEVSLICVGTPSQADGSVDLRAVEGVCDDLGAGIRAKSEPHTVVVRSTVPPGTTRDVIVPRLEAASGRKLGDGLRVAFNPEFLREGSGIHDFRYPAKIVVGVEEEGVFETVLQLYGGINAENIRVGYEAAEFVKYTDNVWHALKVAFANEVGNICQALHIDSHEVMGLFCRDTKLNISAAYLKPGFAFGGSCLPKELEALNAMARGRELFTPLIASVLPANDAQVARGLAKIKRLARKRLAFLGISFKSGTDDLRHSPLVALVERLLAEGYDVKLFDGSVSASLARSGDNSYVARFHPELARRLERDVDAAIESAELVVVGNGNPQFDDIGDRLRIDQQLLDLVRVPARYQPTPRFHGVNW
jgi:GDP-mannose 6-dehydrogenase